MYATLAAACAPSGPDAAEAGWWVRLARPPAPPQARPLEDLADTDGGWTAGLAGNRNGALCHEPGAEMSRPLPGGVPADFEIRLRARTEAGRSESYGLAFRRDRGDEYLARVDTRNNNVRLYRHDNGTATLLAARDLGVTVGRSHELAVRAVGATLAVALDGEPLLRATDHGRADGAIALWAETPTRVCFERLWLAPVDTTP